MSEATKDLAIALATTVFALSLLVGFAACLQMPTSEAGCYHGIAQSAYDECRADAECVKPPGFKAEPLSCRE